MVEGPVFQQDLFNAHVQKQLWAKTGPKVG